MFGCRTSPSAAEAAEAADESLWNRIGSFRSLGVVASGVVGSRSLSWLLVPGTARFNCEPDGAVEACSDGANDALGGVAARSTADGGVTTVVACGATGVKGATWASFRDANRPDCRAGDFLEGSVLLRDRPLTDVAVNAGLPGLGAPFECRDRLEDVDLFLRIEPSLATLSAPALAVDADRTIPGFGLGVDGSTGVPLWTSSTVLSSAAVPCIPMRK